MLQITFFCIRGSHLIREHLPSLTKTCSWFPTKSRILESLQSGVISPTQTSCTVLSRNPSKWPKKHLHQEFFIPPNMCNLMNPQTTFLGWNLPVCTSKCTSVKAHTRPSGQSCISSTTIFLGNVSGSNPLPNCHPKTPILQENHQKKHN